MDVSAFRLVIVQHPRSLSLMHGILQSMHHTAKYHNKIGLLGETAAIKESSQMTHIPM